MTAQVLAQAAQLCRRFEGFRAAPYVCPAGVWTIGYGSTRYADGRAVAPGDAPVLQSQADAMLQSDLAHFLLQLLGTSPGLIAAQVGAQSALLDFVYNLGVGRYRASTLRRKAEASDWEAAKAELMKWTRGGGRELPGLVARRRAEAALLS
jgi:lysozyme